jgi:hypothetical protein
MDILLSKDFSLDNSEVVEFVAKINESFKEKNKDDFCGLANIIAEVAFKITNETAASFHVNLFLMLSKLSDLCAMSFTQALVRIRIDGKAVNDIIGDNDALFFHLKKVSKATVNDPDFIELRKGEAFFN